MCPQQPHPVTAEARVPIPSRSFVAADTARPAPPWHTVTLTSMKTRLPSCSVPPSLPASFALPV